MYNFVCGHVENCIIKVLHSKMQYIVYSVLKRHSDIIKNHVVSQIHMGLWQVFHSRTRLFLPESQQDLWCTCWETVLIKALPMCPTATPESPELAGSSAIIHPTLSLITALQGGWALGCQPVSVRETLCCWTWPHSKLMWPTSRCRTDINTKKIACVFFSGTERM